MSAEGISYDNMFIRMLSRLGDAMLLSLLFVVCSIPIVTIGASLTALYYTAMKGITLDSGYVFKYFMKSFKENFKKSTLMWLAFLLAFIVFGVDVWFWYQQFTPGGFTVANVLLVFSIILLALTFFMFLYAFPLQAKFENTIQVQLRNAFLLSVKYFPTTLLITVITAVIVWSFYYQPAIAIVGYAMVGFGAVGYLYAYFMLKCFKPYLPEEEEHDDEWYLEDEDDEENEDNEESEDEEDEKSEDVVTETENHEEPETVGDEDNVEREDDTEKEEEKDSVVTKINPN